MGSWASLGLLNSYMVSLFGPRWKLHGEEPTHWQSQKRGCQDLILWFFGSVVRIVRGNIKRSCTKTCCNKNSNHSDSHSLCEVERKIKEGI